MRRVTIRLYRYYDDIEQLSDGEAAGLRESVFNDFHKKVERLTGSPWCPYPGLMFIGGMAGSTSGAMKVYRLEVLAEASRADVRRLIHPRGIFVTRVGKSAVPDTIVEAVQTFFLLYMFAFMTGTFLLAMIEWFTGGHLDMVATVSAVASSLGNVGPGLGEVGPASNYLGVSAAGKILLSALMIVGRLEILPILILFNRELWKR